MSIMDRLAACEVEVERPGRMIVRGLDGKPAVAADGSQTWFDIHSADSLVARKHERAVLDERLNSPRKSTTAADLNDDGNELLVVLTAGWGIRTAAKNGEPSKDIPDADFSPDAARKLYADPRFADVRNQVNAFAGTRINFAKASPRS